MPRGFTSAVRLRKSGKWSPVTVESTSKAGKTDAGVGEGALGFLELGLTTEHRLMGVCPRSHLGTQEGSVLPTSPLQLSRGQVKPRG